MQIFFHFCVEHKRLPSRAPPWEFALNGQWRPYDRPNRNGFGEREPLKDVRSMNMSKAKLD